MSSWSAYETVLNDLRGQRERIDVAIAAIEALRPAEEPRKVAVTVSRQQSAIPSLPGRFGGMTIVDASIKVLEDANGPVHVGDITDRVISEGVPISGDAPNTVGSILNRRMREKGDVQRIGRGTWALTSYVMSLDAAPTEPLNPSWDFVESPIDELEDDNPFN